MAYGAYLPAVGAKEQDGAAEDCLQSLTPDFGGPVPRVLKNANPGVKQASQSYSLNPHPYFITSHINHVHQEVRASVLWES